MVPRYCIAYIYEVGGGRVVYSDSCAPIWQDRRCMSWMFWKEGGVSSSAVTGICNKLSDLYLPLSAPDPFSSPLSVHVHSASPLPRGADSPGLLLVPIQKIPPHLPSARLASPSRLSHPQKQRSALQLLWVGYSDVFGHIHTKSDYFCKAVLTVEATRKAER